MRAAVATFLIALPTAPAFAQPPATDPVVAHFRDYRAAIDRQDFAAAETAATAALEASEAGKGSRTAVLALNLALLRLTLAEPAAAHAPAARAHELATSRTETGVRSKSPCLRKLDARPRRARGERRGRRRQARSKHRGGRDAPSVPRGGVCRRSHARGLDDGARRVRALARGVGRRRTPRFSRVE